MIAILSDPKREEWRLKVAWERFAALLDRAKDPVDPDMVNALALQAAGYGAAFVEAMWPTPKE